jgi:hypothetical protein
VKDSSLEVSSLELNTRRYYDGPTMSIEQTISARGSDCVFCGVQESPGSPYDVVTPLADKESFLVPALGMLMPGNYLQVARKHVTSFAQMGATTLNELCRSRQQVLKRLSSVFGSYIMVEHGSDGLTENGLGSGACIDHAHNQLLPDPDSRIWERMRSQPLNWTRLRQPEELENYAGRPYIYLSRNHEHYAASNPQVRGQWARMQAALALGQDVYDWAVCDPYPHPHLLATMRGLSKLALESYEQ